MIVGVSGRVSFKDESEAEILVEDIVPIENIASLGRARRGGRYGDEQYGSAPADYHDRGPADYRPEPQRPAKAAAPVDPVKLRIPQAVLDAHGDTRRLLMHVTDMISLHPGDRDVLVYLPDGRMVRCNADNRITFTDDLRAKLVRMLGEENVKG